jgi:hypothetical protein
MRQRKLQFVVILAALLATAGCIKKVGGNLTPWERVHVHNAMLAQLNNDVAKGVAAVQSSGLITPDQAKPILNYNDKIAKSHLQITAILEQGPGSDQSAQLLVLLNAIQSDGQALVKSGGLGVKNPRTQETVAADIDSLVNLAKAIIADVNAIKGAQ